MNDSGFAFALTTNLTFTKDREHLEIVATPYLCVMSFQCLTAVGFFSFFFFTLPCYVVPFSIQLLLLCPQSVQHFDELYIWQTRVPKNEKSTFKELKKEVSKYKKEVGNLKLAVDAKAKQAADDKASYEK